MFAIGIYLQISILAHIIMLVGDFPRQKGRKAHPQFKGTDLERGNHYVDNCNDCCSPGGCCGSVNCPIDTALYTEETRGAKTGMGTGPRKSSARLDVTARETCC